MRSRIGGVFIWAEQGLRLDVDQRIAKPLTLKFMLSSIMTSALTNS